MADWEDVRDALVTRVGTVTNVGNVLDRQRYIVDWDKYLNTFKYTVGGVTGVRVWWVEWQGIPGSGPGEAAATVADSYFYVVHGYLQLNDTDDTSTTFNGLVELAKRALHGRTDFGLGNGIDYSPVVTVPVLDVRSLGSVMCHHCEIHVRLTVRTAVTWA